MISAICFFFIFAGRLLMMNKERHPAKKLAVTIPITISLLAIAIQIFLHSKQTLSVTILDTQCENLMKRIKHFLRIYSIK